MPDSLDSTHYTLSCNIPDQEVRNLPVKLVLRALASGFTVENDTLLYAFTTLDEALFYMLEQYEEKAHAKKRKKKKSKRKSK
jgi:hypothetical protein